MTAILVLTTFSDEKSAEKIAQSLIRAKLAACVSMSGAVKSRYWWRGRIESATEYFLFIKTLAKNFEKVKKFLLGRHPYESPEIIGLPITKIAPRYYSWMKSNVV